MKLRPNGDIEDLLKDRADQYLLYPSDAVWNNIQKELHPARTWIYVSVLALLLFSAGVTMVIKKEKSSLVKERAGQIAYRLSKSVEGNQSFPMAPPPEGQIVQAVTTKRSTIPEKPGLAPVELQKNAEKDTERLSIPLAIQTPDLKGRFMKIPEKTQQASKEDKKNLIATAFETVVEQAKKIRSNASWQLYGGLNMGYRFLSGEATRTNYQYAVFSLSTNAQFPRNVKDVVNHRPGMGFEIGSAMYYPITKKLSLKAGLQANYNHYQIDAYSSVPEIANYGMNNLRAGSIPISTVSFYSNTDGYRKATLRNEHYMLSLPIGIDYVVAGNKKVNLSLASTIQPTYVFANYSYLISTNLKNYAKEPTLNRRWNINSGVEASLNIQQGAFKWSIAPQFRYQLISSFKDKYPIRENLTDMGIKVGLIRTLQ